MNEHLPECPVEKRLRAGRTVGSQTCICDALRSCERRLIEWVRTTIVERIFDLEACHKDDNCRTLAQGADLALSDVLYDYPRRMERHE
jgi:hypothetical protein